MAKKITTKPTKNQRQTTTDVVEILHRRYYEGRPERIASLEEERANAEVEAELHQEHAMPEHIEIDPRRCGGSPIIKGTRIPVAVILEQLASGESKESLLRSYPKLTADDIEAALLFAKDSDGGCD